MHTAATIAVEDPPVVAGPIWTMEHGSYLARCQLRRLPRAWELRVFIDGELLLTERCSTPWDAWAVSSGWRTRLRARGWSQSGEWTGGVLPMVSVRPSKDRRQAPEIAD